MKNQGWMLLGSVTVIALGYAVYDLQSQQRAEEARAERERIVAFNGNQINQVEILSRDISTLPAKGEVPLLSNKIRLLRHVEGWRIEEPIQEAADQKTVDDFVEGIVSEKAEEVAIEGEEIDWKIFGLDEPRGQIALQNNLGEKAIFHVSAKKNFQGDAFLRKDQENKVWLASGTWFAKVEKKPADFRDKRLYRQPAALIRQITHTSPTGTFVLNYQDQAWVAAEKPDWKLDQQKVRDFLATFANPTITDFAKESTASPEEAGVWGLQKPLATVTLQAEDKTNWKIVLGTDATKTAFAQRSEPPSVVKLANADANKLAGLRLSQLRDRKQAFDFRKAEAKTIEVRAGKAETLLTANENDWTATKTADPALKIESSQVSGLLSRLSSLEIGEFPEKSFAFKGSAAESVVIKNAEGVVIFELQIQAPQKIKMNGRDLTLAPAQSSLASEAFYLTSTQLEQLRLSEFLRPQAVKPVEPDDDEGQGGL